MKAHLNRLAAPKSWAINRKERAYVQRPKPSGHRLSHSLPLVVVIRDLLKFAKTAREVKYVLNQGIVLINGKVVKEPKRSVGLMDVIEFSTIGKTYRVLMDRIGKLVLIEQRGHNDVVASVSGKTTLKGKKTQLNLLNGMNIIATKDLYKVGDTIVIGPNGEIKDHFRLEKGSLVYFIGGKHVGETASVEDIKGNVLMIRKQNEVFETRKGFAFVIGRDQPVIEIP